MRKYLYVIGLFFVFHGFTQDLDTIYSYHDNGQVELFFTVNHKKENHGPMIKYYSNGNMEMRIFLGME